MREEYRVFQIDKQDTVATALQDIPSGERVHIIGNCTEHSIVATTDIPVGHKMALKEIVSGEEILKYGVCIGNPSFSENNLIKLLRERKPEDSASFCTYSYSEWLV